MCILCYLIPLLVGLICTLLGYFLGKMLAKRKYEELENKYNVSLSDLDECKVNTSKLRIALDELKSKNTENKINFSTTAPKVNKKIITKPTVAFDSKLAADVLGKKIKQDDLKIVEGIGPKIEQLFKDAGVKTWAQLADISVEKCQEILKEGGDKFVMHNPETWPKQASFAAKNDWVELKKWQQELSGGRK